MNVFKLKDTEIHSLPELREHFDLAEVMAAFLDGTLEQWLDGCYYERESEAVAGLEHTLSPATERKLCAILGVEGAVYLTPEQQTICERKRAAIRQFSDDPALLARAMETATNQSELAELLDAGCQSICLCGGSFTVPIRKSGVHYTGVGNPHMEAPFTEEQYRRAGITFEGITLPQTAGEEAAAIAGEAAENYGYDGFAEEHNRLVSPFHDAIKGRRLSKLYNIVGDADTKPAGEFYRSRGAAERAARRSIEQAYDQANRYFQPGQSQCAASWLAKEYAAFIRRGRNLALALCPAGGKADELGRLISQAETALRERFEQELRDRSGYYEMYKKSYFLERVEIEKEDYNLDPFDSDLLNGLARLIHDESEYGVENLFEILQELDEDVSEHMNTFFEEAYRIFREYCREIEDIAEEIGKDLSDDDLRELGILKEDSQAS